MDDAEGTIVGENIIDLLYLKVKENGRVDTSWGDKTPLGLFLTLERLMKEDK
jgi:hypothetical protein